MSSDAPDTFASDLLTWYKQVGRDLPWRRSNDPYSIWVSEVMLQQTQVSTVIPYWTRWMERFPNVQALSNAKEADVLSLWQGLGYYRRARMLLEGARFVCEFGIPSTLEAWRKVPGVGPYTAGAIASIAQGIPAALVDGNVERVFARLTTCNLSGQALERAAWAWANQVMQPPDPGSWNQALMELGATVCKPKIPVCEECPIKSHCAAYSANLVQEFPIPTPKPATVRLTHEVWIPQYGDQFGLRQIPLGEWWEGMWEFPRAVADREKAQIELRDWIGDGWLEELGTIAHTVTHHRITIHASRVRCEQRSPRLSWLCPQDLEGLPLPAPQRKLLKIALKA